MRAAHEEGLLRDVTARKAQLRQLRRLLVENEERLLGALAADLGKPAIEGYAADIGFTVARDQRDPGPPRPLGEAPPGPRADGRPARQGLDHPRAARRGARHRPVELPGPAAARPGRGGARRRQRRRAQAVRGRRRTRPRRWPSCVPRYLDERASRS